MLHLQQQAVVAGGNPIVRLHNGGIVSSLCRIQKSQRTPRLLVRGCGRWTGLRHVLLVGSQNVDGPVADVGGRRQPVFPELLGEAEVPLHHVHVVYVGRNGHIGA